jgi:hypothetical protein
MKTMHAVVRLTNYWGRGSFTYKPLMTCAVHLNSNLRGCITVCTSSIVTAEVVYTVLHLISWCRDVIEMIMRAIDERLA